MDADSARLNEQIEQLKKELAEANLKISDLERAKSASASDVGELPVAISEYEETLRRLVQRTAMIVQAEKCVVLVRDRDTGDLVARNPAFGLSDEELKAYRVKIDSDSSGGVFRNAEPALFLSGSSNAECERFNLRNGVSVPLLMEKRDDENLIVERITVGVLNCFNKRYGGEFTQEDMSLLDRLSRSAAAIIANAQLFQEVIEDREKLVQTLESLTAGLILINQKGNIAQMNAHARAMFQLNEGDDVVGKSYKDILRHPECVEILQRQIIEAQYPPVLLDGETKKPDEINMIDADGVDYIYQMHAASVRDEGNNLFGTVIIFNDITELRNVERMKTDFVSIVAHELRTPLTPMKGFIRTLLDDVNEEWYLREDRREFYTIIEENVDRLGRLINDLLNISRIERMGATGVEINWESVNIREAAESVAAVQRGRTDRHQLIVDFDPGDIHADTDRDLIQNVLHNVISNAIKYAPGGGEIRIIGRIHPSEGAEPAYLMLGVKDQGMGMTEEHLKKVGEKFNRGDSRKKASGTGLGLWLVGNIIKAHKGKLWAESEGVDKGSTFWACFPVVHVPEENETSAF